MSKLLFFTFVLLLLSYASDSYKILLVSTLRVRSHAILAEGILKHLSKAGHEITYVAGIVPNKAMANVSVVETTYDIGQDKDESPFSLTTQLGKNVPMKEFTTMFASLGNVSINVLGDRNVLKLLNDKSQHFDVAIIEWLFIDVFASFAAVFDCPYIWFSSVEPHWKILRLIDESTNPAYTIDTMSHNSPPLTFVERVAELVIQIMGHVVEYMYFEDPAREAYEKYVAPAIRSRGRPVPDFEDVKYNASLVLGNSHVSLGMANRVPESYKHIGGYHIDREVKPLPKNLKTLFESASHGVIYFSFGTSTESRNFPNDTKRDLLNMFGKLKQTVLWKFEEDLPNRPSNVHITQWAPQQSILAHPKCILFITHGGQLSITEAIHFGVPIIGIPIFADQFANVKGAVKKGIGRKVDLSHTMADKLYEEINKVLSNPTYRQKVKEWSFIYHDRPTTPAAELVHWVEHVVKTNGAPHLRSPALTLHWYQKAYLDLVAVIVAIVLFVKYSSSYFVKRLQRKKISTKKCK